MFNKKIWEFWEANLISVVCILHNVCQNNVWFFDKWMMTCFMNLLFWRLKFNIYSEDDFYFTCHTNICILTNIFGRYFVVVDDLWDASAWETVKCAFPEGHYGSSVFSLFFQSEQCFSLRTNQLEQCFGLFFQRSERGQSVDNYAN